MRGETNRAAGRAGRLALAFALLTSIAVVSQGCRKKTNRQLGDDCISASECESGLCTPAGEFCTKACTYDRDCDKGLVCRADGSAIGHVCAKPIGAPVGNACQAASGCASGNCLKLKSDEKGAGICSTTCMTPADCPATMKLCERITGTGMLKVCLLDGSSPPGTQPPIQVGQPQAAASAKSGEHIGWVKVKNPKTTPANVEYRVGQSANCTKNGDATGTRTIAGGDTWTLEARGESMVCIRLKGATKWWKNRVNHGQTHSWVID